MTPGIGLALLAMVCFGAGDLIYKRAAAAGIEARHFIMLQAWFFCPLVTVYALARQQLVLEPAALWGSVAGLVMFFAFYNFSRSLRSGSISTNAPIFRLSFTLTAALAIGFLHEPLTLTKLAGLALALIAVLVLAGEPQGEPRTATSVGSLTRVLLATGAAGIGNLLYKIGLLAGSPPETLLATQAWVFCSLATLFVWFYDGRIKLPRAGFRYGALAGVTLLAGFMVLLNGLAVGPASVLIPVAQLGFVFTAVLGRLLFAEALSWRKRCGLVVAAAAMVTLTFS
ncbi:MAG: EamA family transporter [Xanthobacteraceae bacterium]|nr:EamA family transporter [Xanthobacteraceae bacterium]